MSTLHSKAAEKFLRNGDMAAWHNETLWMVRAKRDKMSKEVPEWEDLRKSMPVETLFQQPFGGTADRI